MSSILNDDPEIITATAILAKAGHLLTGREIAICAKVINPPEVYLDEDDEDEDEDADEYETLELSCVRIGGAESEVDVFARLQTEFSREIGQWHTEQNRKASDRAIEAHNRITAARQSQPLPA